MNYGKIAGASFETQDLHRQLEAQQKMVATSECRDSEITVEVRRLDVKIEELETRLRELGGRLMAVTRQAELGPINNNLASTPCTTPLGTALRQSCDRLDEIIHRVVQQIDLTEL